MLAEETGIGRRNLGKWFDFYNESERIKNVVTVTTPEEENIFGD